MRKYLLTPILVLLITILLKDVVPNIGFESYKEILTALMTISSIVFAIIGAWVAIIYPKAIERNFDGSPNNSLSDSETDTNNLNELIEISLVSATVLMSILVIFYIVPILHHLLKPDQITYYKFVVFFVVTTLTLWEIIALFIVIISNYFFLNNLRRKNAQESLREVSVVPWKS